MTDTAIGTTSTEVLEHECTNLAAQIAATTCRFLLVVGELDAREAWGKWWGCTSMAHWLAWRCSLAAGTARDHVRVARVLRSLPMTVAAFERGELSYSKVRALVRVITPESEADLVDLARTATAAQLEKIIRATLAATTDPSKRDELRELHTSCDDEGMGVVRARLRGDELAIVEAALDAASVSAETSRVDALVKICESYLATGDASRAGSDRYAAVVHVELGDDGVVSAETDAGLPVPVETAERILCDSTLHTIVHGRLEPLGAGRASRTPGRRLRRAIRRRSGGRCEWVGCTEQRYVEVHHVQPWSRGGATEWSNLVALCWHHHHLVHEGGWRLAFDAATAIVRCFRPDGSELLDPIAVPVEALPVLELAEEAIVPRWAGERLDLGAAVDAVLASSGGGR